jgi:hypothetical protein
VQNIPYFFLHTPKKRSEINFFPPLLAKKAERERAKKREKGGEKSSEREREKGREGKRFFLSTVCDYSSKTFIELSDLLRRGLLPHFESNYKAH